jgi:hypothetical protein
MARAALRLGLRELAAAAKVSTNTVTRFERGEKLHERTVDAIRSALESAGIYFTNGDRRGLVCARTATIDDRPPCTRSNGRHE